MEIDLTPKMRRKNSYRVRFEISLDAVADRDIIEILDRQPNKSDFVRELIRKEKDT